MPVSSTVKMVKLSALHGAAWNPRTIKDDRFKNLMKSVQDDPDFLYRRPILAMKDGTIYAGNMRFRAAQQLGMAEVPAIIEDITPELAKERAIKDNGSWGDWDRGALTILLGEFESVDLSTLGFNAAQLEKLIGGASAPVDFPTITEELTTNRECPKCGYQWSDTEK